MKCASSLIDFDIIPPSLSVSLEFINLSNLVRFTTQDVKLDEPHVMHKEHPILKVQVHKIMAGMTRITITS